MKLNKVQGAHQTDMFSLSKFHFSKLLHQTDMFAILRAAL